MNAITIDETEKYDCMECDHRAVTPLNGLCPHCGSTYLVLAEMDETLATPNKFERVEGVPQWAFPYLMGYGDDEGELSEEDRAELDAFRAKWNIVSDIEGTEDAFNKYPYFGLPGATVDVYATPINGKNDTETVTPETFEPLDNGVENYEGEPVTYLEGEEAVHTCVITEYPEEKAFLLTISLESEQYSSKVLSLVYPFKNYQAIQELKRVIKTRDYDELITAHINGEAKGEGLEALHWRYASPILTFLNEVVIKGTTVNRVLSENYLSDDGKAALNGMTLSAEK